MKESLELTSSSGSTIGQLFNLYRVASTHSDIKNLIDIAMMLRRFGQKVDTGLCISNTETAVVHIY